MGAGRVAEYSSIRFLSRVLLVLVAIVQTQAAMAQTVAISPSVVLVLKLVSATLVKPTTGIVVSADGMVLVPAEFAAEEGEMLVLDGGADIIGNGRPARLVAGNGSGDLAVLSVKGLKRPAIKLAGNLMQTGGALHLEAFPPAEYIAKGAQPLSLPVKVTGDGREAKFSTSPQTPLPYVTGAILDACGNLAGVSLTSGPQSLDSGETASILFADDLGRILAGMQLALPSANCARTVAEAVAPTLTTVKSDAPVAIETTKATMSENEPELTVEADVPESADSQPSAAPVADTPVAPAVQKPPASTAAPPPFWRNIPAWLPLLVIIVLGVSVWKGIAFFKLSGTPAVQARDSVSASAVQPASDEPETAPLDTASADNLLKPRSAPVIDFDLPVSATRPDGCNGVLLVEGLLEEDTPFKRFCFVDTAQIDAVIGRGSADIAIEHAAISRNHARIESAGGYLTFSDLGSRNGSFIGDVPCLPGEIMFLEGDDEIFLGEVQMTIRVVTQEAEWA